MHSFSGLARTLSMSRINTTKRKCIKKGHYTVFIDAHSCIGENIITRYNDDESTYGILMI